MTDQFHVINFVWNHVGRQALAEPRRLRDQIAAKATINKKYTRWSFPISCECLYQRAQSFHHKLERWVVVKDGACWAN